MTAAIAFGLVRIEATADLARRGVAAADSGSWAEAQRLFGEAIAADPDVNIYHFELGVSAANAGDLHLAEQALATSAGADDYPYAWLDLAAVRWRLGDAQGAGEALARAERLGLQRAAVALGAGWIHQQLGDEEAAIEAYGAALSLTPALANDPFWSGAPVPGDGAVILDELESREAPSTLLVTYLVRDQLELARESAAVLAATESGLYENLVPAWQGDPEAWRVVQGEAINHPTDVETVGWCRLVAAHLGDQAAVRRYSIWLAILGGTDSGLPSDGRIVTGSAEPLPPYILDRYGSIYRREVIASQVVSGLLQIAWRYGSD